MDANHQHTSANGPCNRGNRLLNGHHGSPGNRPLLDHNHVEDRLYPMFSANIRHSPIQYEHIYSAANQTTNHEPKHSTPIKNGLLVTNPAVSYPSPSSYNNGAPPSISSAHASRYTVTSSMRPLRTTSPTRLSKSLSALKPFGTELENGTIQKQRQELQMLITELKDRDRELNDMVAAHQRQMLAWEEDRQRVLTLEQKCARLNAEVSSKSEQVKSLKGKLKARESEDKDKATALQCTQEQLSKLSEQHCQASMQLHESQERNASLTGSMKEMCSTIGQLEAREQELITMLKMKDKDLIEASDHISDLSAKLKRLDRHNKEHQKKESEARRQASEWKQKHSEVRQEVDRLRGELGSNRSANEEQFIESEKLKSEIQELKKELELAAEREKRKDELVDLQKSKQERADAELGNLRQIYERQQRDLSLLHLNLESSKDLLAKHRKAAFDDTTDSVLDDYNTTSGLSKSSLDQHGMPSYDQGLDIKQISFLSSIDDGNPRSVDTSFTSVTDGEEYTLPSAKNLLSPTSKLHRLLAESRQMVEDLEKTTLPPFVGKYPETPAKDAFQSPPVDVFQTPPKVAPNIPLNETRDSECDC
ncbi:coiled-coil domain-containing protein 62-like isoform X2 [Lineus longissimus]|uniref:coiled-coil domain-containing protein 62-like isoform X2 n=1 Tax=Lineus longissimus TaxID=88925 RepID=UPI002B4EEBD7